MAKTKATQRPLNVQYVGYGSEMGQQTITLSINGVRYEYTLADGYPSQDIAEEVRKLLRFKANKAALEKVKRYSVAFHRYGDEQVHKPSIIKGAP